jgi:hypothetical protein
MKLVNSRIAMVVMVGGLLLGLSGAVNPALPAVRAQEPGDPANTAARDADQPGLEAGGMPGWPAPQSTIPYHEPGRPSRSAAYTTQVTRLDAAGVRSTVRLTGLDAMTADGIDPLAGNYLVAESAQIMAGGYTYAANKATLAPSEAGIARWPPGHNPSSDVAAGDLNGDGIDEQIAAWLDDVGHLNLQVGAMPGQGRFTSAPAAVSHTDGSADVLARGLDGVLYRGFFPDGGQWENGAGLLRSGPAIASRGDGSFDCFAIGMDNLVYRRHWDGNAWSGDWELVDDASSWAQASAMPGLTNTMPADVDAPAAVARGAAQIDLFRRGPDNTLRWRHSDDGSAWGSWQNLGGVITSAPSAVSRDADLLQVFARGVDGAIWYCTLAGGDCGEWGYLEMPAGISAASAPTVVSPPGSDEVYLYVYGSDGELKSNHFSGGAWQGWAEEVLPFDPAPAAAVGGAYHDGQIDLFVLAEDGTLQQHTAGGWGDLGRPACMGSYTGNTAYDRSYGIKVTAGHFMGAGRELIAVAAVLPNSDAHPWVLLFDVRDGFEPYLRSMKKSPVFTAPAHVGTFDIAAGDVTGSGVDQILLASMPLPSGYGWILHRIQCHQESVSGVVITNCDVLDEPEQVRSRPLVDGNGWEHIHVAAGDIDGDDAYDEWALVVNDIPEDGYESFRYIYDTGDGAYWEGYHNAVNSGYRPADVTIGNVIIELPTPQTKTPPQKDEVIFVSAWAPDSLPRLDVYRWVGNGADLRKSWSIPNWTPQVGGNVGLETGDLNGDLREEIALNYMSSYRTLRILGHRSEDDTWADGQITIWNSEPWKPAIGDFLGQSLRLGPPTYRVQEQMTTPIMFLNLPPMHHDIVENSSGQDVEIEILNEDTYAEYETVNTDGQQSTAQSSREWSLSTGFETSVGGMGATVKTSFDNTYGENFSKASTTVKNVDLADTITANMYDQVIYNATTYGVWEYPVLGVPEGEKTGPTTVSVVYPLLSQQDAQHNPLTEPPSNKEYPKSCDENFYAPAHQTYNVWSYDPIGSVRFADYANTLVYKRTTGGSSTELRITEEQEDERTASYHDQISAGLEFSYENELNIPLIGKAWDFSFRAYANGSYGKEDISTFSTTLANDTAVTLAFPSISNPSAYTIDAYLYEAKGGYWALDYQTQPDREAGYWQYYDKPDPAFTLNWYGWPLEPDPALRYPCGQEKQLFSHDLVIEPQYAQVGETVTISATVRNFSPVPPAKPVTVRFYQGDPALNQVIDSRDITGLDRATGPQTASITWTALGTGKQRIFALIDPNDTIPEMHDAGNLIDNNTAYGLVYVAGADYVDPGLQEEVPYQEILAELRPGLEVTAFVPTADFTETLRYELVPMPPGSVSVSGGLFRLDVYEGGQADPSPSHALAPTPAMLGIHATNQDITGLNMYRFTGTEWVEVTCPGYEIIRIPETDRMYVPVCELAFSYGSLEGTFALSTAEPEPFTVSVYLPLMLRGAP